MAARSCLNRAHVDLGNGNQLDVSDPAATSYPAGRIFGFGEKLLLKLPDDEVLAASVRGLPEEIVDPAVGSAAMSQHRGRLFAAESKFHAKLVVLDVAIVLENVVDAEWIHTHIDPVPAACPQGKAQLGSVRVFSRHNHGSLQSFGFIVEQPPLARVRRFRESRRRLAVAHVDVDGLGFRAGSGIGGRQLRCGGLQG